jgi:PAS domain S-box-containing protein
LAAALGLQWAQVSGAGSPVWPAFGISLAALILWGRSLWPAIFLGRLLAGLAVGSDQPLPAEIAIAAINSFADVFAATVLLWLGFDSRLRSLRDTLWLIGAVAGSAAISASLGTATLTLSSALSLENAATVWSGWWFGNIVAGLTIAPLILSWFSHGFGGFTIRRSLHLAACLTTVVTLGWLIFHPESYPSWRTWHLFPALIWAALAFDVRGASAALLLSSALAIWGVTGGAGTFENGGTASLSFAQQFIAVSSVTILLLAAIGDERRRIESLARLAALASSSPDAIIGYGTDGKITSWNAAAEKVFGYTAEEAIGRNIGLLKPSDEGERFAPTPADLFDRAMAGGNIDVETIRRSKDGELIDVHVTGARLLGPRGEILGALSVLRDIRARKGTERALQELNTTLETKVAERTTELVKAQEQLRQSQKMEAIGQLTGGVAHDFNNLLTIIRGSADLLRREGIAEIKKRKYIEAISETADRAAKLTSQLLAFARRQALKPESFDAAERVRRIADMIRTVLGPRITVEVHALCDGCFITADVAQFETALINIAVNARDAMGGEGDLRISVEVTGHAPDYLTSTGSQSEFVAVKISDSGIGIPEEVLGQVFEPFFTTKTIGRGTGLGLSQVYGFARQSGGDVLLESEVGKGTTVSLIFPRVQEHDEQPTSELNKQSLPSPKRILLVEDNREVGQFAMQLLMELGHTVTYAESGELALKQLERRAEAYDLVFTDVMMPGMSGIELAEEVRQLYPSLRVVLTSGYSDVLAQKGDHGFDLLQKPYSMEALIRVL